jgi:hypothetical protein
MSTDYTPPPSITQMFQSEREGDRILRLGREAREAAQARGQTITRSADRHAQRAEQGRAQDRTARQLEHLGLVASERADDEALERAIDLINRGGTPGAQTRAGAMRALERQGGSGLTSAQQLAAGYFRRVQPQDDDDPRPQGRDFDYTV